MSIWLIVAVMILTFAMRIFRPNIFIETIVSTILIICLAIYPWARGFDNFDWISTVFYAILMTSALGLHFCNLIALRDNLKI
jgi:hypothetical protein